MPDDLTKSGTHWLEGVARTSTANPPTPRPAIVDLTHSALTGTPNDVMEDIATADAALESDLKELAVKVNAILAALRACGIVTT